MQDRRNIEALFPLTPLQQGILFHSLYGEAPEEYFDQVACTLHGDLDAAALAAAWRDLVARHGALRTAVVWEDLAEPVQAVLRRVDLPWEEEDWRALSAAEVGVRFADHLAGDRARGFELRRAPLTRCCLLRVAEDEWRFVWSRHHLILDAWSASLLLAEMAELYAARRQGRPPELAPAPPFRDYVTWLRSRDAAASETYWRRALEGFREPTPLAAGASRPAAGAVSYGDAVLRLGDDTDLAAAARRLGVTPASLMQGAWGLLLGLYSGRRDVVFGGVVAGRPPQLDGAENTVGLFLNTLPVRLLIDPEEPVADLLQRLQRDLVEQREHGERSLVEIQGWSQVPRGLPLFDSLFVYENYPQVAAAAGSRFAGVEIRDVATTSNRTGYPWALAVEPQGGPALRLTFDRRRFDAATAQRALRHLAHLVGELGRDAKRRVGELTLPLETAELAAAAGPRRDYAGADLTLHGAIEEQARRTPEAPALVYEAGDLDGEGPADGGVALTYRQLDRRANLLAHRLRAAGARRGTRVAVCAGRSADLVVGLLAVLKAGAAYVPLESEHPAERLRGLLADCAAAVLLADPYPAAELADAAPAVVELAAAARLDDEDPRHLEAAAAPPADGATADDAAYVIYTSGSTGRPKGVVNAHRGVRNRLLWMQEAYRLDAADTVLQKTPYGFDVSVWEFFWPLACGARLAVARPGGHRDAAYLLRAMRRHRVTVMHFVPSMLQLFVDEPALAGAIDAASLRLVVLSGEALAEPLMRRALERLAPARLENLYGPTEAAIDVTRWSCSGGRGDRVVPIGRPIANVDVHVVDAALRPRPRALPGELVIGGAAPAVGYLGRAALTAERFVPDPFAAAPGQRLYRTGDRVRRLPDGEIEFLGRIDFQVKIRGQRVEPGEIEAALVEHPAVREAVVVARADAPEGTRLVAHLVSATEAAAAPEISDFLRRRLPEHMVPGSFEVHAALPLNSSGKADRRALAARPLPERRRDGGQSAGGRAPAGPAEEVLARLFEQLLGVPEVAADDSFFALGGHSLLALRLLSRVRSAFAVELPLADLFAAPTVAALAQRLEERRRGEAASPHREPPPVETLPRDGDLPLSFAQQRLWFLDQLEPGSPFYNVPVAFELRGELGSEALRQSFGEVVRRHEVLRTTFPSRDGEAAQRVAPPAPPLLPRVDLSALPAAEAALQARRLASQVALRSFDLAAGPLVRAVLLRLPDDAAGRAGWAVGLCLHHIVSDHWSLEVMVREMGEIYRAYHDGEPSRLGELPVQYADYAAWQRRWLEGGELDAQLTYWKRQLADPPPLELPPAELGSAGKDAGSGGGPRTSGGRRHTFALGGELSQRLHRLAADEGVTLYMTLLAAFHTLLYRLTGVADLAVGTPVAGRGRRELEGLIGIFINNLVLRGDLSGNPTFRQLLARTRRLALDAWAHQDVPFDRLVAQLRPGRDGERERSPLFQVAFGLLPRPAELELPGLAVAPLGLDREMARYDLTLWMVDGEGGLGGQWTYSTDLFSAPMAERLGRSLSALLSDAVERPDARLDALRLESDADRRRRAEEESAMEERLTHKLKGIRRRSVRLAGSAAGGES